MVFYILFFLVLITIWVLLLGVKAHDKTMDKVEKFAKENLTDKKENE